MARQYDAQRAQTYAELRKEIDSRFPPGQFVAVEAGRAVADAESYRRLVETLHSMGKSPKGLLIVQAGAEYPDSSTILPCTVDRHAVTAELTS